MARVGFQRGASKPEPNAAPAFARQASTQRAGVQMLSWSHMRKQPNGIPGKKPRVIDSRSGQAGSRDELLMLRPCVKIAAGGAASDARA